VGVRLATSACAAAAARTQPRNDKGDAYAWCKACHPGAIERRWTPELVLAAVRDWLGRYGRLPTSYDRSSTHARRRGGDALARLAQGEWPAASVVTRLFGTWSAARALAAQRARDMTREPALELTPFGQGVHLPAETPRIDRKTEDLRGGELIPEPTDLQVLVLRARISPIIRVGEVSGSNPSAPIQKPRKCGVFVGTRGHGGRVGIGHKRRNMGVRRRQKGL
jgi:hypothetical protein